MIHKNHSVKNHSVSDLDNNDNNHYEEEDYKRIFLICEEHFREHRYVEAERTLNQLVLKNYKKPHVFHMLGTIYYDQGKFNKAVRSFKRALEIDPQFTDSSIGLSILLNDLGRYEEGQKVFERARELLTHNEKDKNHPINEKLSSKHKELGELYSQYKRYDQALTQYFKALSLSPNNLDIHLSIVDCFVFLGRHEEALHELKDLCKEHPFYDPARLKLGQIYYKQEKIPQAISEWQEILRRNPQNLQAKTYLEKAQLTTEP